MKKKLISNRFKYRDNIAYSYPYAKEQLPIIDKVKERIFKHEYNLINESCFCGESKGVVVAELDRYNLPLTSVICENCGSIRIDPYLDQSSVAHFYTFFYQKMYGRSTSKPVYFEKQGMYGRKVLDWIEQNSIKAATVLEIGCGAGGALKEFEKKGISAYGCEFDEELLAFARARGVTNVFYGSIEDIGVKLNGKKFDLIFSHHVLEHIGSVNSFFEGCRALLHDHGLILHIVPDIFALHTTHSNSGDLLTMIHIAHKYNYSERGLHLIAAKNGLQYRRVFPSEDSITHMSGSPEIWSEFRLGETKEDFSIKYSGSLLKKLLQIESRFQRNRLTFRVKKALKKLINGFKL